MRPPAVVMHSHGRWLIAVYTVPEPTPDRLRRLRWLMTEWIQRGWVVDGIAAHDVATSMANRWPSLFAGRATLYHDEVVYEPAGWVAALAAEVVSAGRWTRADLERADADLPRLREIFADDTAEERP